MLGGDGGFTAIDFSTPTTAYAETQWVANQSYIGPRRSDNLGSSSFVQKLNGITLSDRAQFIPPLVMSPSNSQTLYFGTYRLYRTIDRADTWTAISSDLSKGSGSITAIAQAKSNSQVIYVGTSDGNVQVTTNGGGNWAPIITGLPNRYVTYLAVHPTDPQTAFVTYSGFGTGHVFKTTNSGATWTDMSNNLPNMPVNTVLLDPAQPATEIYLERTSASSAPPTAAPRGAPSISACRTSRFSTSFTILRPA